MICLIVVEISIFPPPVLILFTLDSHCDTVYTNPRSLKMNLRANVIRKFSSQWYRNPGTRNPQEVPWWTGFSRTGVKVAVWKYSFILKWPYESTVCILFGEDFWWRIFFFFFFWSPGCYGNTDLTEFWWPLQVPNKVMIKAWKYQGNHMCPKYKYLD